MPALVSGDSAAPGARAPAARARRARAPPRPPPLPALGRRAPARRRGPRARQPPGDPAARRRADRARSTGAAPSPSRTSCRTQPRGGHRARRRDARACRSPRAWEGRWSCTRGASAPPGHAVRLATLVARGLRHHRRDHLGVLLAVAIGAAVLTGALIVGDSARHTLRRGALQRLGRTELALAAPGTGFAATLADRLEARLGVPVAPLLREPAVAVAAGGEGRRQVGGVRVFGVDAPLCPLRARGRGGAGAGPPRRGGRPQPRARRRARGPPRRPDLAPVRRADPPPPRRAAGRVRRRDHAPRVRRGRGASSPTTRSARSAWSRRCARRATPSSTSTGCSGSSAAKGRANLLVVAAQPGRR